jgi:hypothetical protein
VRLWSLVATLLALPAAAEVGNAEPRILWSAPAGCPGQAEVVHEVEQLLRQPLDQSHGPAMTIQGRMAPLAHGGYRVLLDFSAGGARRQRQIEHDDCGKLTEAAALVMAMAIDPERMQLSELPPPPASASPPAPVPPRATEPQRPAESRPVAWSVAVMGLGQAGPLPGSGPGIGGQIGVAPLPSLRLAAGGSYWFAENQSLAGGASADFWMWSAGVRGCSVHDVGWELMLCGGPELGRITGTGLGLREATTATDWWGALILGFWGGYHLSRRLDLLLGVEGGASLVRPRFGVEGLGQVFRPAPWLLRAGGGLGFRFP